MKTNCFILLAAILWTGFSWEEYTGDPELRKGYIQTYCESQNSTENEENDSTCSIHSNTKGVAKNDSTAEDSTRCDLFVEGKLIVDGGTSSDISNTYVTVEKITVNVWADGKEMVIYYPVAHTDVAEPSEVFEWESMPAGINYGRKRLNMEPLTISYKDYFYAEVTVYYILRVRDTKLAAGCTADRYRNTVTCGTSSFKENRMTVLVPLELQTITFSATVDDYV